MQSIEYTDQYQVHGCQQFGDKVELEFQAFRLQQFEISGSIIGSRNFRVQYEAVSLNSISSVPFVLTRLSKFKPIERYLPRCIVTSWRDLVNHNLNQLLANSVGAILVLIPSDLDALTPNDRMLFADLERKLGLARTELAVYVSYSSPEANAMLTDIQSSSAVRISAIQRIINSVAANITSTGSPSTNMLTYKPNNIIGRLSSGRRSVPTIAFVAHYDSHAPFPGVAVGADSNGSGIVVLLELVAIFRKFYERVPTRPPFNLVWIVFAWTAAGKHNYQGTRQFIEDLQTENSEDNLELAICVEALGGTGSLYMHASKQPVDGSAADRLLRRLRLLSPNRSVELVTKKINVNQPSSWEHEKFNIKRLPAITLSGLSDHDNPIRKSLLDTVGHLSLDVLERNIRQGGKK
ncbi:Nicastrin [Dictyocaulus viviparus]|uniref:BOS complex subunit NCLN n=1 Tax=Dictyocaulus viviparus TaxID=29172 RepID=A0A0D8XM57_DICVI|nr:Nicastrin [Dictyocaulus viviparus]